MGTLTVTSCTKQSAANYLNEDVMMAMSLNYNTDANTGELISINGSVTDKTNDRYIGNFNGNAVNGTIQYNFSGITDIRKLGDIATCLEDIQSQIQNENNEND